MDPQEPNFVQRENSNFYSGLIIEQGRQCTQNVKMRRVGVTIVAV